MPVPLYRAPKDDHPWGLLGDIGRAISPPGYVARGPFGARSAAAAEQPVGRPEGSLAVLKGKPVQWALQGGKGSWVPDYKSEGDEMRAILAERAGAPSAPILPAPGKLGATPIPAGRGTAPIVQAADEEYKALLSQYGGAPGVQQLAGMAALPVGFTPTGGKQAAGLQDYYAAQRAVGAKNIGEITGALGYQKGSAQEQWAQANPMLAMREFNQRFPAGAPTTGPSDAEIAAAQKAGQFYSGAGSIQPSPVNQTSFSGVANAVPAPPQQQGAAVSAPYAPANAVAAEKTAGATGMPNLQTTAQPQTTLDKATTFIKALFPTGVGQLFYPKF